MSQVYIHDGPKRGEVFAVRDMSFHCYGSDGNVVEYNVFQVRKNQFLHPFLRASLCVYIATTRPELPAGSWPAPVSVEFRLERDECPNILEDFERWWEYKCFEHRLLNDRRYGCAVLYCEFKSRDAVMHAARTLSTLNDAVSPP